MTKIKAFKAIRPAKNKAHLVASREISSYTPEVLEEKLNANPYTFIHIIYPEVSENDGNRTAPNSKERFLKVKSRFEEFIADEVLIQDTEDTLYIYRQTTPTHSYLGVIGGASLEEYENNTIKKHEATLTSREEMFTRYLDIVGFNAEPVLLSHRKSKKLDVILDQIVSKEPEYNFTTTDRLTHELWLANDIEVKAIQTAYAAIDVCYIADGHHRTASSDRYRQLMKERGFQNKNTNFNYSLSFFIDEERLQILPFNRLCKTLNWKSKEQILTEIEEHFSIERVTNPCPPKQLHDIMMYLESQWYLLRYTSSIKSKKTVAQIDAEILTQEILAPILGIHDLKTDKNISFSSDEDQITAIKQSVDSGVYQVGFLLYPVTMDQLKAVADNNEIMPPKSTWIEPKLRSGLTIYKFEND